jgi:glyoxylase-like metal-dependent hydrolase (beta-lactamase superfamily II)
MCLLPAGGRPLDDPPVDTIRVGEVTATRLELQDSLALTAAEFFPGVDPALWEANRPWLHPAHWDATTGRVRVVVQSWLLRSGGLTVLVDTGLSPAPTRAGVPAGGSLPAALAAAGVAPTDVDVVVCTHLHPDHVGGNTRDDAGEPVPAFPRARYLFSRPDLEFFDPRTLTEGPGRSAAVFAESIGPVLRSGQAHVWDGSHSIDERLTLSLAPGHTPGAGVLAVESGTERALFVGDLLHSPVQVLDPGAASCFCHDPVAATRSRHRVLGRAADQRALVVPGHFGGEHAVRVRRSGNGFELDPRSRPADPLRG